MICKSGVNDDLEVMVKVLILGAGLTGLSAAYHLGNEDYLVLEKHSRVGGLCRTEEYDGFLFDLSIHILYTQNEYVSHLIRGVLLKGNYHEQVRESWIYSKGVYTEYPFQAHTYGLPPDVIKECILGLIEAKYGGNRRQGTGTGDREQDVRNPANMNFEEWIYRTFGKGIAKHFMIPYNRKQWAFDLKKMNCDWIAYRVPVPDLEDVLDGALKPPQKKYGPNSYFWYPCRGGIEALPRGFLPYVGDKVVTNAEVVKIHSKRKYVELKNGETIGYEKLIYTLPLPLVSVLLDDVPPAVRKAAEQLEYNIIHMVNLGVDRPKISDFHWVYFPEDDFIFHRISYPMNFHPSCVPEGRSSIMCEVSESRYKRVNKETLIEDCIRDLKKAAILKDNDEILIATVHTLNPAYVIYDLEHRQKVKLIHEFLKSRDIYPAGRFGDWEYFNMDHSILAGARVCTEVVT